MQYLIFTENKRRPEFAGFVEEWFRVYEPRWLGGGVREALHSGQAGIAQGTTGFYDSLSVLSTGFPSSSTTNNNYRKEKEEWK